ncbi:MAG: hypothetical protein ABEK59_05930 [Halobacteria archaeon]
MPGTISNGLHSLVSTMELEIGEILVVVLIVVIVVSFLVYWFWLGDKDRH